MKKLRRNLYRAASVVGDIQAISKGIPGITRRVIRKGLLKRASRWIWRI